MTLGTRIAADSARPESNKNGGLYWTKWTGLDTHWTPKRQGVDTPADTEKK